MKEINKGFSNRTDGYLSKNHIKQKRGIHLKGGRKKSVMGEMFT